MDPVALRELFSAIRGRANGEATPLVFVGADLRGAFLLRANLNGGSFERALFDHASLPGSRLVGTNLRSASLVGIDLNGADLTGSDLSGADLSEARIEGACFSGTDCRGACLRNLRGRPGSVAGMRLDHAACVRSDMDDARVIQLWRDGATLEDPGAFSDRVQHACHDAMPEASLLDIRSRDIAIAEAHRRTSLMPEGGPPSLREGTHRVSIPTNRILNLLNDAGAAHEVGDEFLGVTLVKRIGTGPNGSVWKANSSADGTPCSVKLFEPKGGFHETQAGVFKRGTDTLNRIALCDDAQRAQHINVRAVALNQLGFVYDYYDNGNMTGISVLGWDLQRKLGFYGEICRAIRELHELGIAHRALKPQNVLLDDQLHPVLTDAGMIGFMPLDLRLFTPDTIYRAPEELGGESTLSPTADIYSLGRLLWFLLLGRDPDEQVQGVATLASLQKYPAGILRVIRKATAQDPALRYQWVRELEQDLANYRSHERVGISGAIADTNLKPYCISSLPAPPLEVRTGGTPLAKTALTARKDARAGVKRESRSRVVDYTIAGVGLLGAAVAVGFILLPSAPAPATARWAAAMFTTGVALATLFLKPLEASPRLWRLVLFTGAWLLVSMIGPERLAIQRWKFTLSHGAATHQARAAKYLAREGARDFSYAELSRVDLRGIDLGCAVLRNANLSQADLTGANLSEADLTNTRLSGANLRNANLRATDLARTLGFSESECNWHTKLPEGWRCGAGHPIRL